MDKIVGLLLIVCIAAVSGQEYVVTLTKEVQYNPEQPETPPHDPVNKMFNQLAAGIHRIQTRQNVAFPCRLCEELMLFAFNMTLDQGMIDMVQAFVRKYACTFWAPAGYLDFCNDYVDTIPDTIRSFGYTFFSPRSCSFLCPSQEMDQKMNVFNNIFKKLYGA